MDWIDLGDYYLHTAKQGSPEHMKERVGRLTSTNVYDAVYGDNILAAFNVLDRMPAFDNFDMMRGRLREPIIRDKYVETRQVEVMEVGIAVPKWDNRLGTSIDGGVIAPYPNNGIIEIKAPREMYPSLLAHLAKIEQGWTPPPYYHDHIYPKHYYQMLTSMEIVNRPWTDYVVDALRPDGSSSQTYIERVYRHHDHWVNDVYPRINTFFDKVIPIVSKWPTVSAGPPSSLG